MQPVICFYKDQKFIHSTDYQLISCGVLEDTIMFLRQFEKDQTAKMKIVKINFSALEVENPLDKRQTYIKTPKAQVFILNSFDLLSQQQLEKLYPEKPSTRPSFEPTVSENTFLENVRSIKEDICEGRFYQINYTAALQAECADDYSLLKEFIHTSKTVGSDYRAFLPLAENEVINCLSPEMFLQKTGVKLSTQPIKGTLSSGLALSELENSSKENAELSMIVDLLRNDLNTLSCTEYNDSSRVNFHRKILDVQYALHTYSEVEINTSKKLSEIIDKTFPGGSISGCPKKESLKKIAETENYHRDFYTGSIGWWQNEDFCLNIAIRSSYQKNNKLYYFTGCGIVFDSEPRQEWHEFLTKASFLNLSLTYMPVVDTLAFKDLGFTYLEEHIERTYLALRSQMMQLTLQQVKAVYQNIEKEIRETTKPSDFFKVRLVFAKDLTYQIELSLVEDKDVISLQPMPTRHFLPQYKTSERSVWNSLLQKKKPEADDILVINTQGMVVETSIYSVFYKKGEDFFTPPITDGGIHSVFRAHHIKKGSITVSDRTYKLSERSLLASELKSVELYVANSVRGLKKTNLLF
jgi:anthranilate/para-aminobenzoate synthase component I/branched-subunit amino acid aminotransferase/4-amino-4-deoxychorismate lyase